MSDTVTADQLRSDLTADHPETAPMMRWWWFGPAVERDELGRQLEVMAQAGIGGAEVAFVYPLEEATATFGSPELLADLRWAAERARALGLRFDLTLGSGWSYGGPHITPDLASRRLHWDRHEIGGGGVGLDVAAAWPGDRLVAAYLAPGAAGEPVHDAALLPTRADGDRWHLDVPPGSGPRQVLLAWSRLTGQQVKRAAAGAEGPVLDHYSAEATRAHLRAVADPMLDAVPAELLGSVFCDSLEVYAADWTHDLPTEFERRRGYPLLPGLPRLLPGRPDPGSQAFRADYHRTLVDLYEERFAAVVQAWAAARGVPFRLQGYGTPPATLSSYRFADLVEGEGWGWTELTPTRWASSAAHHYGRGVVSAEAWTWVHSPSFRATPLDLLAEAHEHLLNGVTLLIGHGWPYSPADAPGLGWFFYAAGCLDDRNPWWPAMPALTRYLSRVGWLLQQGTHVADVAVYVPTADLLSGAGAATGGSLDCWREAHRAIGPEIVGTIRRLGLDYRLFDDDVVRLTAPEPPAVVVVPAARTIPPPTRAWLESAAAAGSRVLLLGSPVEIAGAEHVPAASLGARLRDAVETPFDEPGDIGLVHRRTGGLDVRFLVNTVATPGHVALRLDGPWQAWDPSTGDIVRSGTGAAEIDLEPYGATVVVSGGDVTVTGGDAVGRLTSIPLDGDWQVAYPGAPSEAVRLPHRWEDDPARAGYSGAATYRYETEITGSGAVVLDLGAGEALSGRPSPIRGIAGPSYRAALRAPVGEIAEVRVNGQDCGVVWAPPYRVDIGHAVRTGTNAFEITVHNTAANALAHDSEIGPLVARTEERYGRRFVMQELDRALDGVSSGLLGVPVLRLAEPRS